MVSQSLEPFQAILRGVLHFAPDISKHINELLLAAIIVLTLYTSQILIFLRCALQLCRVRVQQGALMFELAFIE